MGMVKQIVATHSISIPSGVNIKIKSRRVEVQGCRGSLYREFRHLPVDIYILKDKGKATLVVDVQLARQKFVATIQTLCTHLSNMIIGVSKGYMLKMKTVYGHFPINVTTEKGGKLVEIRNFLGEKRVRRINMLDGVICEKSNNTKDEIV